GVSPAEAELPWRGHAPRLSPPPYKPQSVPHASTHSLSLPRTGQPVSEAIPSPVLEPPTGASNHTTDAANRARPEGTCHNVDRDCTAACDHAPTPSNLTATACRSIRQTPSLGPPCAHSRPRLNS
ncbi:unnamed protein product, partial [Ixodes persulcatus]